MIEVDGTHGEGGGQILRTALGMALVTGQACRVTAVRAGRSKPGLAPQHLAGVLAAVTVGAAEADGAVLGSTEVVFRPGGPARAGDYTFDIAALAGRGSAGAVTLLIQTLLPPLALADGPSVLRVRGGTFVPHSPPVFYLEHVLLPTLARLDIEATLALDAWGFYPRGGGQVTLRIAGRGRPQGVDLTERGRLRELRGVAVAANLPAHIAQRIAARLNRRLADAHLPAHVAALRVGGVSTGAGAAVAVAFEGACAGFSALGERGKPSEAVADEAADAVVAFHRQPAALDPHLPDQLLPFLALAVGPSRLSTERVTRHLATNRYVVERFCDRAIRIDGAEGEPGTVEVV